MEIGKYYLTAAQKDRAVSLAALRLLFEGAHKAAFYTSGKTQHVYKALGPNAANVMYITENLPGRCTLKYADLLFGEPLGIAPSDKNNAGQAEGLKRISDASRLHGLLFDAAATASWSGAAWLSPLVVKGVVKLTSLAPELVFPQRASGGELAAVEIIWQCQIAGTPYARVIRHAPGKIEHELWELNRAGMVQGRADIKLAGAGLAEVELTGLAGLAIVEAPNYSAGGPGLSDYAGEFASLVDEVNNRRTQISRVLDVHADPVVQALESLFDENGNLRASGKVLAVEDASKPAMQYITWQAQLSDAASALADARDATLGHMDMAPELLGKGAGTSADSWKKFKLSVVQTLARVNRKRIFLSPAISEALTICCLLENRFTPAISYAVSPLTLTWADGLPVDEEEQMRVITGYRSAGLISRRRSLMILLAGNVAAVEAELAELTQEDEASLPTGFQGQPPGLADEHPPTEGPGTDFGVGGKPG